jgi:hypothetical protein
VADFIGESNILPGVMLADELVEMCGEKFPCVDSGFGVNQPGDVVGAQRTSWWWAEDVWHADRRGRKRALQGRPITR